MPGYTIGQVAERSGFSPSALRYYERIGLVVPAARTPAGYRRYDDDDLGRLAFIGRAKRLGCSLEEIADLVPIWDGRRCGPVQRRFHELVTGKISDAERRMTDLATLTHQLRDAAEQLAGPATDGPCGDDCACVAAPTASGAPPIACTLDPDALPDRLAEWHALVERARSRTALDGGGLRVELHPEADVAEVARLVAAEQRCCAFFSFAITVDERGVALEVRAPEGAGAVVASLFGSPD